MPNRLQHVTHGSIGGSALAPADFALSPPPPKNPAPPLMDLLPDELVADILRRLPPTSAAAASLACRRFLLLHRWSRSSLSLPTTSPLPLHLLPLYPSLTSLALSLSPSTSLPSLPPLPSLRRLRLLSHPPTPASFLALAAAAPSLTSLSVASLPSSALPLLPSFPRLHHLSLLRLFPDGSDADRLEPAELGLESISLTGVGAGDAGLGWLWRSCGARLRRLRLRSCASTGDSFRWFAGVLPGLDELELRTCRGVVDWVLLMAAAQAAALTSLLVHDGGSRDGLLWFLTRAAARPVLRSLDFRLPLDLQDDHLLAAAGNFPLLTDLRLQSCCLVTGGGLRSMEGKPLSELVLINCDAVEREPGLLTTLVPSLKQLKRLDLSYNDKLRDRELCSMLASCGNLVEMRLKGCKELTGSAMAAVCRFCKLLQVVDVVECRGIGVEDVELLVLNLPQLGRIFVEERKLSDEARSWMWLRSVQLG